MRFEFRYPRFYALPLRFELYCFIQLSVVLIVFDHAVE